MRWKQFFTPAKSIPAAEAKAFMAGRSQNEFNLIDVRQPGEYETGHIPGSKLLPIADLSNRLAEIDRSKPTSFYCAGLRDFYLFMIDKIRQEDIKSLFQKLAEIETGHQDRIFNEYLQVSQNPISREAFENDLVIDAVEGGLTTDEYVRMFKPDWESAVDIISLAMSIEAQALDLYTRAAERNGHPRSAAALKKIAEEERAHLVQLGNLMDERM